MRMKLAVMVAVGGLTAATTTAAHAAPATAIPACHANSYEVKDSSGNYVQTIDNVYDSGGGYMGYITVQLWYCPNYQSNFVRAELVPRAGISSDNYDTVQLVVRGTSGNSASVIAQLYPDGTTSDSPAYHAPAEAAQACVYPIDDPPYAANAGACTEFV